MSDARGAQAPSLHETTRIAADGAQLFVRHWRPVGEVRGQVVVVHGYQEHGGRYRELAHRLAAHKLATVAADLRGHGRSSGARGHVRSFSDYVDDVDATCAEVRRPDRPTFVLGHSLGGLIALRGAQTGRFDGCAGIAVTNPYLALAMPVPRLKRLAGRALGRVWPSFGLPNGIDPAWLSRDPEVLAGYRRDPMLLNHATAGWYVQTLAAQAQVCARPTLPMPLWFAYSDTDPVASPGANAQFAHAVQAPDKTVLLRAGELHELLQEKDRLALIDTLGAWLAAHCG